MKEVDDVVRLIKDIKFDQSEGDKIGIANIPFLDNCLKLPFCPKVCQGIGKFDEIAALRFRKLKHQKIQNDEVDEESGDNEAQEFDKAEIQNDEVDEESGDNEAQEFDKAETIKKGWLLIKEADPTALQMDVSGSSEYDLIFCCKHMQSYLNSSQVSLLVDPRKILRGTDTDRQVFLLNLEKSLKPESKKWSLQHSSKKIGRYIHFHIVSSAEDAHQILPRALAEFDLVEGPNNLLIQYDQVFQFAAMRSLREAVEIYDVGLKIIRTKKDWHYLNTAQSVLNLSFALKHLEPLLQRYSKMLSDGDPIQIILGTVRLKFIGKGLQQQLSSAMLPPSMKATILLLANQLETVSENPNGWRLLLETVSKVLDTKNVVVV